MCSGDKVLKTGEKNQSNFTQQLMGLFTQQFGKQSAITDFLTNKLTAQAANPTGLTPAAMAAERGNLADTTATQFQNAEKGVQATMAGRGDFTGPVKSGVDAQIDAQLKAGEASTLAGGLGEIAQQDQNLKQQNYWNAIQGLSGTAGLINPQSFAGLSNEGTSATSGIGQAYNSTTFGSKFISPLMSGLGQGLGSFLSGGMGGLMKPAGKP